MKIYKRAQRKVSALKTLVLSDAPLFLTSSYFILNTFDHFFCKANKQIKEEQRLFRETTKKLNFTTDWFTLKLPTWLRAFHKKQITSSTPLNCLEIGSWQGMSALFTLMHFNNASITCVDTWEGSDENKSKKASESNILSDVERMFDSNTNQYKSRICKYRGTSYQFFNDHFENSIYDLVYIDGSHHSDDVIVDAFKAFEMLKVGGLMIFDDYFWRYYPKHIDNPSGAINAFIRAKRHQLKVICFDYQLVIEKTDLSVRQRDDFSLTTLEN